MPNEGEGSKTAARAYNRAAKDFARDGSRVHDAAARARRDVEHDTGALRDAERAGRARVAEEDPELFAPTWWTQEYDSAWDRVKAAVRRDWEQTKHDLLRYSGGPDLNQSAGDTVRQMAGAQSIPPGELPNPPDIDVDWNDARPAIRYGYGAAHHYRGDEWPDVESRLSDEWSTLRGAMPWPSARYHVYLGWYQSRDANW